jgi:hypothetical protein
LQGNVPSEGRKARDLTNLTNIETISLAVLIGTISMSTTPQLNADCQTRKHGGNARVCEQSVSGERKGSIHTTMYKSKSLNNKAQQTRANEKRCGYGDSLGRVELHLR